jgi:hypothetical protein
VSGVLRRLTMHLGPDEVLVNAEVHISDGLDSDAIEGLVEGITQALKRDNPAVSQTFIELHEPQRMPEAVPAATTG